jgi:plastocyanin
MRLIAVLAAALVLALAGCGGDDDENGGGSAATSTPTEEATPESTPEDSGGGGGGDGGGETIQLAAPEDGSLVFEPSELSAAAGEVTIDFDNPSSNPHAVAIEGNGVDETGETVTGDSTSLTATLEAGEYTFYCPVTGHREGGMEGTLTVE